MFPLYILPPFPMYSTPSTSPSPWYKRVHIQHLPFHIQIPPPQPLPVSHPSPQRSITLNQSLSNGLPRTARRRTRITRRQLRPIARDTIIRHARRIPPILRTRHIAAELPIGHDADALIGRLPAPLPAGPYAAVAAGGDLVRGAAGHALLGRDERGDGDEEEGGEVHSGVARCVSWCLCGMVVGS